MYDFTISTGLPPTADQLEIQLGISLAEIRDSLGNLAAGRALVLQPSSREILMANPFSAVPTPFAVRAGGRLYWRCPKLIGAPASSRSAGCLATPRSRRMAMEMLSEDDLNLKDMTPEELDKAWDLWFDLAQTTNDSDPPYTHGVLVLIDRLPPPGGKPEE